MIRFIRLAAAVLVLVPLVGTAAASAEEAWGFDGGGWGHGVGLSQFGALGQAEDGRTPEQILQHYYSDQAEIETPLSGSDWFNQEEGLWVGISGDTAHVSFQAVGPGVVTICQPTADCSQVNEQVTTTETWHFEIGFDENEGSCRVRRGVLPGGENWGWGLCDAMITQPQDTATRVEVEGTEYPHGTIELKQSTNGFHAVVALTLEDYLLGLAEMPSSWHSKALETQAIIGRSYAVSTALNRGGVGGTSSLSSCGCHLRSTNIDQVYSAWSKENPANGGDPWKAAVVATVGQIVTHPSSAASHGIISTFYSSSNGGGSENNEDVWGGTPLDWLRSVIDPWSADPDVNPLATWTVFVAPEDLEQALGWDSVTTAVVVEGPPGAIVRFTGKDNGQNVTTDLNGTEVRSLLNTYGYKTDGTTVRTSPWISGVSSPVFTFDDIDDSVFKADIEWAKEEGITSGCNPPQNNLFCPDEVVSREAMAAFLNRALVLPPATQDYFTDDDGSIFEDDINRLAEAGITTGCGGTSFCPGNIVDRGQMAAFLVRALGLTDDGGGDLFVDDNNSIFERDIDRLGTAGITKGCNPPTNDRYCPDLPVDRGAMMAFLHRALVP